MDIRRRNTIKMLLTGIGVAVTNQSLPNIAQASKLNNTKSSVNPHTFTQQQYHFISLLSDVILPTTDTPCATELALPQFAAQMFECTLNAEQQTLFLKGLNIVSAEVLPNKADDQSPANDFQDLVTCYFSLTAKEQSEKQALIQLKHKDVPAHQKTDFYRYYFLLTLRAFLIIGFISHETIARALHDPRDFPQPYQPGNC